jgi:HAD superfamily hydrolase (TIGR01509 family)
VARLRLATPDTIRLVSLVRALLFDLDGVIVDSEPVWERVRRGFVGRHGGTWSADAQSSMMGVRTTVWSATLSELLADKLPPGAVADAVIGEMAASYRAGLPLIGGATEVVGTLAKHYPLGLASGSPRVLIDLVLELAGLTDCFRCVLSTDEISRGKPMPDPYLELARRLGFEPADCAAIEDSTNGLLSALAAGTWVVAVPRADHMPGADVLDRASVLLTDIRDLTPELLGAMR